MTKPKATGKPWPKGTSGNPKGRKPDPRRRVERLLLDRAEEIVQAVIDRALGGDDDLLLACLDRVAPKKGPQVRIPDGITPGDFVRALNVIIRETTSGRVTPEQGEKLVGLLDTKREATERLLALDTEPPADLAPVSNSSRPHLGAVVTAGATDRRQPKGPKGRDAA